MKRELFFIKPEFRSTEIVRKQVKQALDECFGPENESRVNEFCQVVSELVNNAIEHGNCSSIEGELKAVGDKAVFLLTTDGVPFDPTARQARMPEFDESNDLPEGGYGLAIIGQLSDEFTYRYENSRNIAVVAKLFSKKE